MAKYLVAIETVKIKEFIFSTNKMRVIRGASYLLDYMNKVEVPKILKSNGVEKDDIIYVGAGNAKFFVNDEDIAKKIIAEVKGKYDIEAPGAKVVGVYVKTEYEKGKESPEGRKIWDCIDELAEKTAIEKNKGFSMLNIDFPFIEKCELSGTEPAEVWADRLERDLENLGLMKDKKFLPEYAKDQEINLYSLEKSIKNLAKTTHKISNSSFRKILFSYLFKKMKIHEYTYANEKNENKGVGFYEFIKDYIVEDSDGNTKINIDTTIQDFQDTDSFIGLMYSDGDGLGDFLKKSKDEFINLKTHNAEDKYLEFMGEFSKVLDFVTKNSLKEVLTEVYEKADKKDKWGEFLIVGGDDVCAVFPPKLVMEISMKFQNKFEKTMESKMAEILKNVPNITNISDIKITSSSGVIIAKGKTPMFQLFDQALHLQKNAKAARKKAVDGLNKTGFIDFQVIGSEGCVDIDDFRKKLEESKVMERPYAINIEENDKNIKNISTLFNIIQEMKKKDFPTNKIRYIYDTKVDTKKEDFEKKMDLINILSKMKKEHIKLIKEIFNLEHTTYESFKEDFTNIFDILELYNFIEKEGGKNEDRV